MKIKYYVNEEKGTVVSKMEGCERDAINILIKDGANLPGIVTEATMNNSYYGKAKLSPEDEWNLEEGKRVARNKMLLKYYKRRYKILESYYEKISEILDNLNERIFYCLDKIKKAKNNQL